METPNSQTLKISARIIWFPAEVVWQGIISYYTHPCKLIDSVIWEENFINAIISFYSIFLNIFLFGFYCLYIIQELKYDFLKLNLKKMVTKEKRVNSIVIVCKTLKLAKITYYQIINRIYLRLNSTPINIFLVYENL